jgi:hypothetical protein
MDFYAVLDQVLDLLRSRCLPPSVDMTSAVKSGEQLLYVCLMVFPLVSCCGPRPASR